MGYTMNICIYNLYIYIYIRVVSKISFYLLQDGCISLWSEPATQIVVLVVNGSSGHAKPIYGSVAGAGEHGETLRDLEVPRPTRAACPFGIMGMGNLR